MELIKEVLGEVSGMPADVYINKAQKAQLAELKSADKEFETLGSFSIVQKATKDAWAHPVVCGGRLFLRYHDTLFCYDVKER